MNVKLTFKRKSKELETSLAVVRNLINVSNNQIKSEPKEEMWQEQLHQLHGAECLLECADFYYED